MRLPCEFRDTDRVACEGVVEYRAGGRPNPVWCNKHLLVPRYVIPRRRGEPKVSSTYLLPVATDTLLRVFAHRTKRSKVGAMIVLIAAGYAALVDNSEETDEAMDDAGEPATYSN